MYAPAALSVRTSDLDRFVTITSVWLLALHPSALGLFHFSCSTYYLMLHHSSKARFTSSDSKQSASECRSWHADDYIGWPSVLFRVYQRIPTLNRNGYLERRLIAISIPTLNRNGYLERRLIAITIMRCDAGNEHSFHWRIFSVFAVWATPR